ncbi:hypothetical protein SeMB42_g00651 [Synchytrium endobioticum]|uniref:Protein kinase domain-containing protein n=1 Tax=Synchytrium endobioticum TaxID=286115 RepID=A0A507DQG1_9FUNG|nr:hypothetical protein SeLEV6574_g03792 [Synchytrium endobioticum]TPX53631.1 hypothetical protein SeMB42_g00651 [Synchytrium endobioticum]
MPNSGTTAPVVTGDGLPSLNEPASDDEDTSEDAKVVETDPNKRFERYNVSLGKGAYKEVFKAFDQERFVEVAWNQLRIDNLPKRDAQHIVQEINLLTKLRNDHIITMYDAWASIGQNGKYRVVFITELMTSGTLKSYIKKSKGPVKPKVLKDWCRQILRGLEYLHSLNPPVIHRDLKAENIFINGNNGQAKIGDLGLAIEKHREHISSVLGTPEFMAPELYDEHYDEKVDIYAFGMVILEIVTKEYPYSECSNQPQIYRKVMQGIKPAALTKVTDEDTRQFIDLCIQSDPKLRPPAASLLNHPFLAIDLKGTTVSSYSSSNSNSILNYAANTINTTTSASSISSFDDTSIGTGVVLSLDVTPRNSMASCTPTAPSTLQTLNTSASLIAEALLLPSRKDFVPSNSPASTLVHDSNAQSGRAETETSSPYKSMSMDQSAHYRSIATSNGNGINPAGLVLKPLTPAHIEVTPDASPAMMTSGMSIPLEASPSTIVSFPAIVESSRSILTVSSAVEEIVNNSSVVPAHLSAVLTPDALPPLSTSPPHATLRPRSRSLPRTSSRSRNTSPSLPPSTLDRTPPAGNPKSLMSAASKVVESLSSARSSTYTSQHNLAQSAITAPPPTNPPNITVIHATPLPLTPSTNVSQSICIVHIIERKSTVVLLKMVYTIPGRPSKEAKFMFDFDEDTATNVVSEMVKENLIESGDEVLARQRLEETLSNIDMVDKSITGNVTIVSQPPPTATQSSTAQSVSTQMVNCQVEKKDDAISQPPRSSEVAKEECMHPEVAPPYPIFTPTSTLPPGAATVPLPSTIASAVTTVTSIPPLASPIPIYLRSATTMPTTGVGHQSPLPSGGAVGNSPPLPAATAPPKIVDPSVLAKLHEMQESALRCFELKSSSPASLASNTSVGISGVGSLISPPASGTIRPLTIQHTGNSMRSNATSTPSPGSSSGTLPLPPGYNLPPNIAAPRPIYNVMPAMPVSNPMMRPASSVGMANGIGIGVGVVSNNSSVGPGIPPPLFPQKAGDSKAGTINSINNSSLQRS